MPRVRPPLHHGRAAQLTVVKRSGATEPFSRDKILAASARPARAARSARTSSPCSPSGSRSRSAPPGSAEVAAHEVGLAILGPLRELDEVAYLRFASVYQAFESARGLRGGIALLRAEREPTGIEPAAAGRTEPTPAAPLGKARRRWPPSGSTSISDSSASRRCHRQTQHQHAPTRDREAQTMTETASGAGTQPAAHGQAQAARA